MDVPSEPTSGPGSPRRRIVFFAIAVSVALAVLVTFREVLAPFALALVVAYVFEPVVDRMERVRILGRKLPRWGHVLALYVTLLGTMAGAIAIGAPLMVREMQNLTHEAPRMLATARDEWLPALDARIVSLSGALGAPAPAPAPIGPEPDVATPAPARAIEVIPRDDGGYDVRLPTEGIVVEPTDEGAWRLRPTTDEEVAPREDLSAQLTAALRHQLQEGAETAVAALRTAQSLLAALVSGIFRFFIMLMISAYVLISADAILGFFRALVLPARRVAYDTLLRRIDRGLAGVVRGQLVICLVNGVLSGIGFWMIGLHYWPVLTLVATMLSIIPIFGAILSSVPAVIVGVQQGLDVALFTLGWIIVIHQIEANLLNPKIMGDAAKVHPVLVVFALIAGEHFFGILGALLAVPVLSIAQSLFLHFREVALGMPASITSPGLALANASIAGPPTVADTTRGATPTTVRAAPAEAADAAPSSRTASASDPGV